MNRACRTSKVAVLTGREWFCKFLVRLIGHSHTPKLARAVGRRRLCIGGRRGRRDPGVGDRAALGALDHAGFPGLIARAFDITCYFSTHLWLYQSEICFVVSTSSPRVPGAPRQPGGPFSIRVAVVIGAAEGVGHYGSSSSGPAPRRHRGPMVGLSCPVYCSGRPWTFTSTRARGVASP